MELVRIGLIERMPNRGAMVRSRTAEAVEQLYEPRDAEAMAEVKAIQADHDSAVDGVDLSAIFRANLAFTAASSAAATIASWRARSRRPRSGRVASDSFPW
jgi:DNA-binding GntR family transcriptional regulator